MSTVVDTVLSMSGWLAYVVVGLLAFGEAAAFIGLVLPGETALLLGGVLAATGRVSLPVLLTVAAVAAVAGDSVGYEIGRHAGPALQRSRLGRRVGAERWARAEAYVRRRGGPAIFLGRWVGVLRALVPTLAGMIRMPYGRFLAWNAAGGVTWASTVVLAGYAAGAAWQTAAGYLGRASAVLGLMLAAAVLAAVTIRWIARHPEAIRRAASAATDSRPGSWLRGRLAGPVIAALAWLNRRFDRRAALGLALTAGLAVVAATAMMFAGLFHNVLDGDGVAALDRPVLDWLATHRDGEMTVAMRAVTTLGSTAVLPPLALLVAGVAGGVARSWRPVLFMTVTMVGSALITVAGKTLVGRPRPALTSAITQAGYSFPSGHSLSAAAILGACAVLVWQATRRWRTRVWASAGTAALVLLIGFSRLYLGVHWLTDVLAAYALGLGWLAAVVTAFRFAPAAARPGTGARQPASRHPAENAIAADPPVPNPTVPGPSSTPPNGRPHARLPRGDVPPGAGHSPPTPQRRHHLRR